MKCIYQQARLSLMRAMNNKYFFLAVIIMLITVPQKHASAFMMPASMPLPQTIVDAQVIVIGRIADCPPDLTYEQNAPAKRVALVGMDAMVAMTGLKPRGQYVFKVLRTIKGQCESSLQLNMPQVLSSYYDNVKFQIKQDAIVLLFLKADASGQLLPVDPTVPFIPLPEKALSIPVTESSASPESQVIALMLASLDAPAVRHADLFLLRNSVDDRIPKAVSPYLNDADLRIQDIALYCMLTNQQVQFIPHVAKLERKLFPEEGRIGSSAMSLLALGNLKTPAAVPYLNPLLFEPCEYSRLNAMLALRKLANRTSIPYFMLALRDPDPQNYIPYGAYSMLHKLIPGLGSHIDWQLFLIQRESASRPLYAWWKDELLGKHLKPSDAKDKPQMSQKEISALPLDRVNSLLFYPVTATRQEAVTALEKNADNSSIPYLILALIDPDTKVAYDAYTTLYRLIPALGTAKSQKEFDDNQEAATHPIYLWWEDELNGNHLRLPKRNEIIH